MLAIVDTSFGTFCNHVPWRGGRHIMLVHPPKHSTQMRIIQVSEVAFLHLGLIWSSFNILGSLFGTLYHGSVLVHLLQSGGQAITSLLSRHKTTNLALLDSQDLMPF